MRYGHREGPSETGIRRGEVKGVDFHQRPSTRGFNVFGRPNVFPFSLALLIHPKLSLAVNLQKESWMVIIKYDERKGI